MTTKEKELEVRVDIFKFQVDQFVEKVKKCDASRIISDAQYITENYKGLDHEIVIKGVSFEDPLLKKLNDSWHTYIDYAYRFDHQCMCKNISDIIK